MKRIYIISLLFISMSALAQQVISSQGGSYSNASYSIDFTIGEVVTPTLSNTSYIVTQGFIQPIVGMTEVPDDLLDYIKANIASAITPNGDGMNDYWKIPGIENFPNNDVKIYNRAGNLIFKIEGYNNQDKVWKGESDQGLLNKSNIAITGTYFYVVNLGPGQPSISGFIHYKR